MLILIKNRKESKKCSTSLEFQFAFNSMISEISEYIKNILKSMNLKIETRWSDKLRTYKPLNKSCLVIFQLGFYKTGQQHVVIYFNNEENKLEFLLKI